MSYPLGSLVPLSIQITDATGALANATLVTVTITLPDTTTVGPFTVAPSPVGVYTYTYTPTLAGRHFVRWIATGTNAATFTDTFDVAASTASGLVSLAEVKNQLNIPAATTTYDAELYVFIDAARTVAEDIAGALLPRSIIGEVADGGRYMIVLRQNPVISVQSVQEYIGNQVYTLTNQPQNATLDNYGYDLVDPLGGVMVRRGSSGNPQPFLGGLQGVLVSYTAGYANIPAVVRLAVLTLIQHWWQNTQQGFPIAGQYGPDDGSQMIAGYAVPNFVQEMLSSLGTSRLHLPGIA